MKTVGENDLDYEIDCSNMCLCSYVDADVLRQRDENRIIKGFDGIYEQYQKIRFISRRIKDGWFSTKYYVTFEHVGSGKIVEMRCGVQTYHKIVNHSEMMFYSRDKITWYPIKEWVK